MPATFLNAVDPKVPLVLVAGPDDYTLTLRLARAGGEKLQKRQLFYGGAHPFLRPCIRVEHRGKAVTLFDASAFAKLNVSSSFNPYFTPELLTAIAHASVVVIADKSNAWATMVVRIARTFTSAQFLEAGKDAPAINDAVALVEAITNEAHAAPVSMPNPSGVVFVPAQVTGYGVKAGGCRALSWVLSGGEPLHAPSRAIHSIRAGARLDAITEQGIHPIVVDSVDRGGGVFSLTQAKPQSLLALAATGSAAARETAKVAVNGESEHVQGEMFAFEGYMGRALLEGDALRAIGSKPGAIPRVWPAKMVVATGAPFLLAEVKSYDLPQFTVGRFK